MLSVLQKRLMKEYSALMSSPPPGVTLDPGSADHMDEYVEDLYEACSLTDNVLRSILMFGDFDDAFSYSWNYFSICAFSLGSHVLYIHVYASC